MREGRVFVGIAFAIMLSGQSLEARTILDDGIIFVRIVPATISGAEYLISLVFCCVNDYT